MTLYALNAELRHKYLSFLRTIDQFIVVSVSKIKDNSFLW